jgi:hypothetical protein
VKKLQLVWYKLSSSVKKYLYSKLILLILRRKSFLKEIKMYKPKIPQDIIQKLYRLREKLAKRGIKKPITVLVREAIEEYLRKLKEI